jgi:hypothetical protein
MSQDRVSPQSDYFKDVQYRGPFDHVVSAYAEPKVEFIWCHSDSKKGPMLDVGCGNRRLSGESRKDIFEIYAASPNWSKTARMPTRIAW